MDAELYKAAKHGKVEFLEQKSPMSTNEESAVGGSGTRTNEEYFHSRTHQDNNNIIHLAARQGHTSFIQKALEQFSILYNQANSRGDTPLHIAARFGHYSMVELLVSHYKAMFPQQEEDGVTNAETNPMPRREIEDGLSPLWRAVNSEGITALDEALRNQHEKVALFLLRLDPQMACFVNGVEESPLYLAAESRCEEVMKEILNSTLPYKDQGPHGQNALHAAKYCAESSIDLLLRKRPTLVKGVDNHGKSALHYAIQTDQVWLITLLLKVDTSIAHLSEADGITPLLKASSRGNLDVCRTILELCPDSIEARNRNGQTVVHLFKWKYPPRVRLFLKIPEVRELINERDDEGNTALHLAIQNHDFTKAAVLIRTKVVDLRITNKEGLTVLDLCESEWKTSYKQDLRRSV